MKWSRIQAFTKAKIDEIRKSSATIDDYSWRSEEGKPSSKATEDCFLAIDIILNDIGGEVEDWGQSDTEVDPNGVGNRKLVRLKFEESYIESL
jgi:hypothetical protein